jgi:hypothetical protein
MIRRYIAIAVEYDSVSVATYSPNVRQACLPSSRRVWPEASPATSRPTAGTRSAGARARFTLGPFPGPLVDFGLGWLTVVTVHDRPRSEEMRGGTLRGGVIRLCDRGPTGDQKQAGSRRDGEGKSQPARRPARLTKNRPPGCDIASRHSVISSIFALSPPLRSGAAGNRGIAMVPLPGL